MPRGDKPVAKAFVATAQLYIHETFLAVESRALQMSRDISSIADRTTKFAYLETEDAETRLAETAKQLMEVSNKLLASTPDVRKCVQREGITDSVRDVVLAAASKIYNCAHEVANRGAGFERVIVETITGGRTMALEVIAAMWFCQHDLAEPDKKCVSRLMEQGLMMVYALPDKTRVVLEDAQSFGEQASDEIRRCVYINMSTATETAVELHQKLKNCIS